MNWLALIIVFGSILIFSALIAQYVMWVLTGDRHWPFGGPSAVNMPFPLPPKARMSAAEKPYLPPSSCPICRAPLPDVARFCPRCGCEKHFLVGWDFSLLTIDEVRRQANRAPVAPPPAKGGGQWVTYRNRNTLPIPPFGLDLPPGVEPIIRDTRWEHGLGDTYTVQVEYEVRKPK